MTRLLPILLLIAGCGAIGTGKASVTSADKDISYPDGTHYKEGAAARETTAPPAAGFLQSPKVGAADAGDLGAVSFSGISGGWGIWLLKFAVGGLLIFSGVMHARNAELAQGGLLCGLGIGIIIIPTAWLIAGVVVVAVFFAYSVYKHAEPWALVKDLESKL